MDSTCFPGLNTLMISVVLLIRRRSFIIIAFALTCLLFLIRFDYFYSWIQPARLQWTVAATTSSLIPRRIWQILLPMPNTIHAKGISNAQTRSWLLMNPDYTYTRFGSDGAVEFLAKHYSGTPYLKTFNKLQNPALKSDFLRYLLLFAEGGVYSDLDTTIIHPVDDWIPEQYRTRAKVLAGIEWDQRDEKDLRDEYAYPVQFQQWTLATVPGHPIFEDITEHIMASLQNYTMAYDTTLSELKLSDREILRATGPGAWTGAVWRYIQVCGVTDLRDLSYMTEPTLFGDLLVFPVNGFGSGQDHSGSARWFTPKDALALPLLDISASFIILYLLVFGFQTASQSLNRPDSGLPVYLDRGPDFDIVEIILD
ncbi:nucleotide-diphospho-sugar transferase [Truncatella angustata]|uniref:Nucleotide-diphospho-sugar transferase n=1 Tax=Truncatella angustata TaxID=152316 RepID=A0A9P8RHH9_9PEZI|nr:nucleotide-diphospho-sugar transferase [Truncatella angustata]KAH6646118.1 nucleotide-diphospho-sugar transferase [Truncatella angustata]